MTDVYTLFPPFKKEIAKLLDKSNVFVVIGDVNTADSNASKVVAELTQNGMNTLGAEPESDISSLPEKPTVCVIATPSDKTKSTLEKCKQAGMKMIWVELGSETSEVIQMCKSDDCVSVYQHSIIKELINPSSEKLEELGKAIS